MYEINKRIHRSAVFKKKKILYNDIINIVIIGKSF